MDRLWGKYPSCETDNWDSLGLFLEGYAFERQGRRPDYPHAAVDAIISMKGNDWPTEDAAATVWERFRKSLKETGLNEVNNPLCPMGTKYKHKTGAAATHKKSIIEFLSELSTTAPTPTLITFARLGLDLDRISSIHSVIQNVNGIGPKIASLFLRDVGVFYKQFPLKDRHLLQPVDVWVGRAVEKLGGPKYEMKKDVIKEVQLWIVENSKAVVGPEEINQGMWYFASQIAGSNYRLEKALDNLSYAKELACQHKQALKLGAESIILE